MLQSLVTDGQRKASAKLEGLACPASGSKLPARARLRVQRFGLSHTGPSLCQAALSKRRTTVSCNPPGAVRVRIRRGVLPRARSPPKRIGRSEMSLTGDSTTSCVDSGHKQPAHGTQLADRLERPPAHRVVRVADQGLRLGHYRSRRVPGSSFLVRHVEQSHQYSVDGQEAGEGIGPLGLEKVPYGRTQGQSCRYRCPSVWSYLVAGSCLTMATRAWVVVRFSVGRR